MGFKPNHRKKFNISSCLNTQLQEAFEKPTTISGQFLVSEIYTTVHLTNVQLFLQVIKMEELFH